MKIIIYLSILATCIACSNSKMSRGKKEIVFDTNSAMMDVYFYPENFDDYFNYTFHAIYVKSRVVDSCNFTSYNNSSFSKMLIFYPKENLIVQKVYDDDKLESIGEYFLNTKVENSKTDVYNKRARQTNKVEVTLSQKAFRNGEWEYYNDGVRSKVETWSMGIMDTVVYFDK